MVLFHLTSISVLQYVSIHLVIEVTLAHHNAKPVRLTLRSMD